MEKLTVTIYDNGKQEFRNQNGELHNPVGPAVVYPNGTEGYWLNGKLLSKEEWEKQVKQVKEVTMEELHNILGYPVKIKE